MAVVTKESSFMPTTEPARLMTLSSLDVSFLDMLPPSTLETPQKVKPKLQLVPVTPAPLQYSSTQVPHKAHNFLYVYI